MLIKLAFGILIFKGIFLSYIPQKPDNFFVLFFLIFKFLKIFFLILKFKFFGFVF